MKTLTLTQQEYLKVAQLFLWAFAVHFTVWYTGQSKRWKRTEYNLPRMVEKGALVTVKYGRKYVYTVPGTRTNYVADIAHGLICTNALLKFKASAGGDFYSERVFRSMSFRAIPEWAVRYLTGSMILFEYSTADNFRRKPLMMKKLQSYRDSMETFEDRFNADPVVLFVFDATRYEVKHFAIENSDDRNFYFVDLNSFLAVDGNQLEAPIYFVGGNGDKYPLT